MTSLFPALPVFLDLVGRSVVLCGGGREVARLAAACIEAGAGVTILDPEPGPEARALAPPARLVERRWKATDFRNAALVACGWGERRPARARASAKAAKALFVLLDGSPGSDVSLGDTLLRGPVTIGVSTAGLSDALASALRDRVQAAAPARIAGFLEAAAREAGAFDLPGPEARRRFWADALDAALEAAVTDWDAWLTARYIAAKRDLEG